MVEGYDLIAVRCWAYSDGAKAEGVSDNLRAFIRACEAALRDDWLDAYLSDRESCRECGESYRFENVSLCTNCSRKLCYKCVGAVPRAPNGNPACQCGGEFVG
ncbi:MAG: hypothetical protein ABI624_17170 [Casimicrobiaceae bacterium]